MNSDIPIFVLVVVRLLLGGVILRLALKGARNLLWLASFFLVGALGNIFATNLFSNDFLFRLGGIIGQILILFFVERSFFQDRPSPFRILLGISSVLGLIILGLIVAGQRLLYSDTLALILVIIAWGWHVLVAYTAYRSIASDPLVEDWVKGRYQLMLVYGSIFIVTNMIIVLRDPGLLGSISAIPSLAALGVIITLILQYLTWGMPEPFRRFLNRNYRAPIATTQPELSEEELMKQLSRG